VFSRGEEWGWIAFAPDVGGVYEEAETETGAINLAYEMAMLILMIRDDQKRSGNSWEQMWGE
jgi:predicted RNase H-like HicB family nuclease